MNIFIFGSNGMLGNYINSYLDNSYNIIKFTRKDYDLNNLTYISLYDFLKKNVKKNDIIINCAGIIPQSSKYKNLTTNIYFKINTCFPIILGQISKELKLKFIHITTDCVFSGKQGQYMENSIKDETNNYGISKSLGEIGFGTIIRTSIIGEEKNNKYSLLEWIKSNKNKEINGFVDHYWNGITCLQLSKIIFKIIDENLFWNGIRHIFSPNTVSKYELCNLINDKYKLNIKINKFKTVKINKTLNTIYNTNKLFHVPNLEYQIKELSNYNI